MPTTRCSFALALLVLLAVPGAASAAPAKLAPKASPVTPAGVTTIEAANPNAYALRGKATMTAGGRTVARRSVRLPRRSVSAVPLRLGAKGLTALRANGGRATVMLRLRTPAGGATSARRTLTLTLPAAAVPQGPAMAPAPPPAASAPPVAPSGPTRWVGRMGGEGPYDDLELTVDDGQLQITKPPLVPVVCFATGAGSGTAASLELFDAPGPWTVGTDGEVVKEGAAVNQMVGSSARTITYKVTGTTQAAGRVAGTLAMSFFDSKLQIPSYAMAFVNCSGTQSFEAIPAS